MKDDINLTVETSSLGSATLYKLEDLVMRNLNSTQLSVISKDTRFRDMLTNLKILGYFRNEGG